LDEVDNLSRLEDLADFWKKLLELFVASHCDSFSLSGIQTAEEMSKVACFADWQPSFTKRTVVRFEWDTPAAGRKWFDLELWRFQIDAETIRRLTQSEFQYWTVSSEDYPADHLYFFSGDQLLIDVEPNEFAIMFYQLTPARYEFLRSMAPEVARALNSSRNWSATTLAV